MSKDIIKKFLSESQQHPDTTEVRIGEQVVTLGDLRALDAEDRATLGAKLDAATKREGELKDQQAAAMKLSSDAQKAYDTALELQKKASAAAPAVPSADWKNDPWMQPVVKELEARDRALEELKGVLKTVVTVVGNAANVHSEDRWDRQYEGIDFGKREKKPTRDELLDFAKTNKLLDRHNLPSVSLAWNKMSEPDRIEDIRKTEREKGKEEGRMEALANRLPPPGVPGPGPNTMPKIITPGTDILGDLAAESLKDPELRALLEATTAAGIM